MASFLNFQVGLEFLKGRRSEIIRTVLAMIMSQS